MKPLEVIFCGNSVYLCGLAAGLRKIENLRVSLVDRAIDNAMSDLKMLSPDVVIFEGGEHDQKLKGEIYFSLAAIAVFPKTDSLVVYGGDGSFAASVDELVQIIRKIAVARGNGF